uniref:LLGL domain-containing protein n=1 Tax=Mesocestoides corti TaxID=53468 RepID=A0A5K3FRB9_MESCO
MWEIDSSNGVHPCLRNIGSLIGVSSALEPKHLGVEQPSSTDDDPESVSHVTALIVAASGTVIFVGTDQGSVASIRRNMQVKRGVAQDEGTMWILPTQDEVITPQRVLQSIPPEKRGRLRLDAVVVLSERPGYPGHLLIGYSSGLCVLFDLHADRVLCLLPCQYELEAVAWCGGSGRPIRGASANPTATPPHLGTRLLTAYANGSLGVWQVPLFTAAAAASGPPTDPSMQTLHMMESPSMPYGPFPCKLIDKVFWLPSHKGGITVFSGGMPRSTYGNRHTVSILRGSNLDQAAAANLAAALRADAGGEDSLLDDDEEELDGEGEEFDDGDQTGLLASGLVPGAPVHVFDSDAPEHVCLDLSSPLVDVCPVGPAGGPAAGLLILCEEEMVAVDLLTPGWPLFSLPYLSCLHTASLTAYGLFTQVNPAFLARLEAVSSTCDRGDAFGLAASPGEAGNASAKPRLSSRPWPIQGGQCVPAAGTGSPVRSASFDPARSLVTSNDLLITGHENGAVAFWRLGPGGCSRNVFTLYTGSLFEGDFGPDVSGDPTRATEEEADPWPPFRRASLFDPFMDDVRAAIKAIRLVDNTLVLGGAAGQVSVWQFSDSKPAMAKLDLPITPEIPGFRWKGNAPLTLRPSMHQRCPGASLFPVGLALSQPPSPVTSIAVCELRDTLDKSALNQPIGVLVAVGSPHGFAVLHLSTPTGTAARSMEAGGGGGGGEGVGCHLLLHHSTIPANSEALEEAAVGEGWARRRTRELKNSLRDSFRRLKRMKSTRSSMSTASTPATAASPPAQSHSPVVRLNYSARVGLRRSVTQV